MKNSTYEVSLYSLCIAKIVSLIAWFSISGSGIFNYILSWFGIPTYLVPIAIIFAGETDVLFDPLLTLLAITVLWIIFIITSLLGIVFKKMRKSSFVLAVIINVADLIAAFFISNLIIKIGCIIVSLILVGLSISCLVRMKHKG